MTGNAQDFPFRQPYEGVIVRRDDPLESGRVTVRLPGIWEPDGPWCFPVGGAAAGGDGVGWSGVPPVGAEVLVFFPNCDPENPRYLAGHHGKDQRPAKAATTSSGDNRVFADDKLVIELDERPESYGLRVSSREDDGAALAIDLDIKGGQVGVTAILGVLLRSVGTVRIEAGQLYLNGRLVLPGTDPL